MNKYESILVLSSKLEEEARIELIKKMTDLISNNAAEVKADEWGLKKLAYLVNKETEGYYIMFTFEAKPDAIAEIERVYRITDGIMKYLTVRKEK